MIVALDHTVLLCPDLPAGIAEMSLLLGQVPVWRSETDGVGTAVLAVENTSIELMAPTGSGDHADRLRELIQRAGGPTLTSLVFQTDRISDEYRRLGRRGLEPSEITAGSSQDLSTNNQRSWKRCRLSDDAMAGIKTFVIEHESESVKPPETAPDQVHAMDHLVIETSYPERSIATFGGRLGLNLALDRSFDDWGVRLLFFRVGGLTLELVHKLSQEANRKDNLWGITWAVKDLHAAKSRLDAAGVSTSDVRPGRKPGSEVFTVKSHSLGIPTLFISHQPKPPV